MIKFFAHINVNASAVNSLLATHCFHPGNVEIYQGLNHSPELDRVLYPQVCMRCLRIAEMLVVVWLSKFSTIIANPASSTDGSFGFKQFHPSKPTVVQGVRHGKGMVQCVARSESSEKFLVYHGQVQRA